MPASIRISAVSTLSVLTDTPGMTARMQANILPPTFQASCPPPQGSDTSAPGNLRQMALTFFRLMTLKRSADHQRYDTVSRKRKALIQGRWDSRITFLDAAHKHLESKGDRHLSGLSNKADKEQEHQRAQQGGDDVAAKRLGIDAEPRRQQ